MSRLDPSCQGPPGAPACVTSATWDMSAEWGCEILGPRWPLHFLGFLRRAGGWETPWKPQVLCSRRVIRHQF